MNSFSETPAARASELLRLAQGVQPKQTAQPSAGEKFVLNMLRCATRYCVELLGERHGHSFGTGVIALNALDVEHLKLNTDSSVCGCPPRVLARAMLKVQKEDGLCIETISAYAALLAAQGCGGTFHNFLVHDIAQGKIALPVLVAAGFDRDYTADLTFTAAAGLAHIGQLLPERTFSLRLPINALTVGTYLSESLSGDETAFLVGVAADALCKTVLLLTAGDEDAARSLVSTIRRSAGPERITAVISARVQEESLQLSLAEHRELAPAR